MKENWKELIDKRILLRKKRKTILGIAEEVIVLQVSKGGEYVRFKWHPSGLITWEKPNSYSFQYNKLLDVDVLA